MKIFFSNFFRNFYFFPEISLKTRRNDFRVKIRSPSDFLKLKSKWPVFTAQGAVCPPTLANSIVNEYFWLEKSRKTDQHKFSIYKKSPCTKQAKRTKSLFEFTKKKLYAAERKLNGAQIQLEMSKEKMTEFQLKTKLKSGKFKRHRCCRRFKFWFREEVRVAKICKIGKHCTSR